MQILEEINTFQTQLDDVARGVNRIRYLKQKINNSLGTLKAVGNIHHKSIHNRTFFSPATARIQTQSGMRKKHFFTLESQRYQKDHAKDIKEISQKDKNQNFNKESKNGIFREKWNDSFIHPTKQNNKINITFRHDNASKLQIFYQNSLMKNINSPQRQQISLQQLKKINYDSVKRQRTEMKMKIDEQKENRNKQVQMKKQKVLIQHRMKKKKTQGFILQKLEDLRARRMHEREIKTKNIAFRIQGQLQLENKETQRLNNLENAILMKQNIRKIIESKLHKLAELPPLLIIHQQLSNKQQQDLNYNVQKYPNTTEFGEQNS